MADVEYILRMHDSGLSVAAVAARAKVSASTVYAVLRQSRPDREKWKRREFRSDFPRQIMQLHGQGFKQSRIAAGLGISRQYVSRVIKESESR